jgi:HPt (histidine-containing phosphotransfer) domain-containing protein
MHVPVIDRERLDSICGGDPSLGLELVDMLIEEAGPLVLALQGLVSERDRTATREQAHALKGIAGNVGAARLQAMALALERAAADEAAWPLLDESLAGVAGALDELRAERAKGI